MFFYSKQGILEDTFCFRGNEFEKLVTEKMTSKSFQAQHAWMVKCHQRKMAEILIIQEILRDNEIARSFDLADWNAVLFISKDSQLFAIAEKFGFLPAWKCEEKYILAGGCSQRMYLQRLEMLPPTAFVRREKT